MKGSIQKAIMILFIIMISLGAFSKNIASAYAKPSVRIAIDPGHGGYDPGVVLYNIIEKNETLDIANRLNRYLSWSSYIPIMTRKTDIALHNKSHAGNTLKRRDLNSRVKTINNAGAKLFISIHVNSYIYSKKQNGTIVYYNPKSPKSRKLAESIQKAINDINMIGYKRIHHDPRTADFYILRNSKIPGVLIETGFASNYTDRILLKSGYFKNKLAQAIVRGIKNSSILSNSIEHKKISSKNKNIESKSVKAGKTASSKIKKNNKP